jgi:two-component system sensor histidine kinase HydH
MPRATFNLRLWFALSSLALIVAICAAAAFWLSSYMTNSQLSREGELYQEFLEAIVAVNGIAMLQDETGSEVMQSPALLDFARHIVSIPGVLRVNIHAPSRRILWSTERQLVGQVFKDNEELDEAFAGERVIKISNPDVLDKTEHVALRDLHHIIEAYIPIRIDKGDKSVAGVVEIYWEPLSLDQILSRGRTAIWAGAAASAAILFLALFWIVSRGAQTIEAQQQRLSGLEAFAAIGQMSSAVAHSLRNPMATIRSTAELWRGSLPDQDKDAADEIIRDVDRMDRYVRDLLTYAHTDPQNLHAVDAGQVLETVVQKMRRAAERAAIEVEMSGTDSSPIRVVADELLLEQVLTSIVTNSIEAMPSGGRLTSSVSRAAGNRVRIEIGDTGEGLPPELAGRISRSSVTTKTAGLGLGLVLARGIIERFGGSLEFSEAREGGTVVAIELRAA